GGAVGFVRRIQFVPERRAALVEGHPEVLRLLIPDELLQHILKAEHRLGRQATRRGQLLTDGVKGAIHVRRPIDKVHYWPLSHRLAPLYQRNNFCSSSCTRAGLALPCVAFMVWPTKNPNTCCLPA